MRYQVVQFSCVAQIALFDPYKIMLEFVKGKNKAEFIFLP
jgi:hypothetical protein